MKVLLFAFLILFSTAHAQTAPKHFKKHVITTDFISEGVAVGDVNKDGKLDILAGTAWFAAPDWKRYPIDTIKTFPPKTTYSRSFLNHCMDINQDGWLDLIVVDFPGLSADWFENPGEKGGYWKKYRLYDNVGNESPLFVDVDGDGQDDLICGESKTDELIWLQAPAKGSTEWKKFAISERSVPGTSVRGHGLGFGDINGDGRKDVITKDGWWEGPADVKQPNWNFHAADIGEECSQMLVKDVNGDGLADIISASAHRYGIWWHPQSRNANGNIQFGHWLISYSTSQTHSTALADFNGDGNSDFVTGKRYFAHTERLNPSNRQTIDPGTYEKPVIYWFEHTPGKSPYWIQHEIDDDSGIGLNTEVHDMNGDGRPDIVVANKKGVFFFENLMTPVKAK